LGEVVRCDGAGIEEGALHRGERHRSGQGAVVRAGGDRSVRRGVVRLVVRVHREHLVTDARESIGAHEAGLVVVDVIDRRDVELMAGVLEKLVQTFLQGLLVRV